MSGEAGQNPGQWVIRLIRGGDIYRAVRSVPGKTSGRCLQEGCDWPGPAGTKPHNISRELMRHTRKTRHRTRFLTLEEVRYVPKRRSPGQPEGPPS